MDKFEINYVIQPTNHCLIRFCDYNQSIKFIYYSNSNNLIRCSPNPLMCLNNKCISYLKEINIKPKNI